MDRKYIIDTEENRQFLKENAEGLLKFGHRFASPGGSSYYLGDDGEPWKDRSRETWITSRMAHVYSIGKMKGHEGSAELAGAAVRGLRGELHDVRDGGWYAGINADGSILPGKHCYAHAFVILAGTSAYLAGVEGGEELLNEAMKIYDEKFWNDDEGLSCDTWNTEFTELDDYRGLNANMHTVEAFLAVADTLNEMSYRERAGRIINRVLGWARNNNYRIPEHYKSDWTVDLDRNIETPDDPFKPYGATPGHAIEWARLITQWATSSFGKQSECAMKYVADAEKLFLGAVRDAWCRNGKETLVYTTDWEGKPVVTDVMHWTLAEAINTSAVLYRVTGDVRYADYYAQFMKYLDEYVMDHKYGSWYHQLDEDNNVRTTVWPGKCDLYHAVQAMLIPYSPVEISIARAVYDECKKGTEAQG